MNLPDFIQRRRQQLGLKRDAFEQKLASNGVAVDYGSTYKWEKGQRLPKITRKFVQGLAQTLEVSKLDILKHLGIIDDEDLNEYRKT